MTGRAILVVGPSWVGDMIMAQSLFKHLRATRPEQAVDLLAPAWSLPVIERMPEVRRGIVLPVAHGELGLAKRRRVAASLAEEGYGQAIVLPRSAKAALVPWLARIPRRTGFRGEMRFGLVNDRRPFDRQALDQTVKRFLALGTEPGEPLPPVRPPALVTDPGNLAQLVGRLGLDTSRPVVAMMPGAEYGPAKRWPVESYAGLARALDTSGFAVWVLGSAREETLGTAIADASRAVNLCGQTALADAVDLLALARHAVTNDSGLMHVAAAAGCHVVALYGSSSPRFTPPLTARKTVHYLDLDCSPCFARECPLGHFRCLREISKEQVLASIVEENESKIE